MNQKPNYDVMIDADELLADLAERAAGHGRSAAENARLWRRSLDWDPTDPFHEAAEWRNEDQRMRESYAESIAAIQPGGRFRTEDGTVAVRGYLRWLARRSEHGTGTAFGRVLSLVREDYGVGWPRLEPLGGNPIEGDLP